MPNPRNHRYVVLKLICQPIVGSIVHTCLPRPRHVSRLSSTMSATHYAPSCPCDSWCHQMLATTSSHLASLAHHQFPVLVLHCSRFISTNPHDIHLYRRPRLWTLTFVEQAKRHVAQTHAPISPHDST